MTPELHEGLAIASLDYKHVGRVGSIAADRFQLVEPSVTTWLRMDVVYTVALDKLTLVCNGSGLSSYLALAPC